MKVVKQQIYRMAFGIAVVCAFALPANAQELKIGYVNIQAVMEQAPQTKSAMDALQEEFAPRQREFLATQREFEELQAKAQKDVAVMGETERRNVEKELRDLQREATRLQNELREDVNLRQNEELGKLQRELFKEVKEYAMREGYDLIVGDGVFYASTSVNITDNVLRVLEASFQATGSR